MKRVDIGRLGINPNGGESSADGQKKFAKSRVFKTCEFMRGLVDGVESTAVLCGDIVFVKTQSPLAGAKRGLCQPTSKRSVGLCYFYEASLGFVFGAGYDPLGFFAESSCLELGLGESECCFP